MNFASAVSSAARSAGAARERLTEYAVAIIQIEHAAPAVRPAVRPLLQRAQRNAAASLRALMADAYMVCNEAARARVGIGGVLMTMPEHLEDAASLCEEGLLVGRTLTEWRAMVGSLAGRYAKLTTMLSTQMEA